MTRYPPIHAYRYTIRSGDSSIAARRSAQGSWLQKLLFSATLNHDPEQLAALNLAHPRLFIAQVFLPWA